MKPKFWINAEPEGTGFYVHSWHPDFGRDAFWGGPFANYQKAFAHLILVAREYMGYQGPTPKSLRGVPLDRIGEDYHEGLERRICNE